MAGVTSWIHAGGRRSSASTEQYWTRVEASWWPTRVAPGRSILPEGLASSLFSIQKGERSQTSRQVRMGSQSSRRRLRSRMSQTSSSLPVRISVPGRWDDTNQSRRWRVDPKSCPRGLWFTRGNRWICDYHQDPRESSRPQKALLSREPTCSQLEHQDEGDILFPHHGTGHIQDRVPANQVSRLAVIYTGPHSNRFRYTNYNDVKGRKISVPKTAHVTEEKETNIPLEALESAKGNAASLSLPTGHRFLLTCRGIRCHTLP